jgi:hypothetical protein
MAMGMEKRRVNTAPARDSPWKQYSFRNSSS